MAQEQRLALIRRLEELRDSTIICYLTNTRANTTFQIGMDVVPWLYDHLRHIATRELDPDTGRQKAVGTIELFIHSNGGDGVVPWRLVTLIREFCEEFRVLVPHRAFSAATLVALGADAILLHPMGVLGPTDPTVGNHFNPPDPQNPTNRLGISVEDLYSYISLIKDDLGIRGESELVQAFRTLTEQLHPLALGNVKRFYAQSRMMARKLLELHMDSSSEHSRIQQIADNLTSKLYFHGHPINRDEALGLGLKIRDLSPESEALVWDLYSDFAAEMKMHEDFNAMQEFINAPAAQKALAATGTSAVVDLEPILGVCLESRHGSHRLTQRLQAVGGRAPNGVVQATTMLMEQRWRFEPSPAEVRPVATGQS